jgi:rhamnogalacturonyl hydrolase YesR
MNKTAVILFVFSIVFLSSRTKEIPDLISRRPEHQMSFTKIIIDSGTFNNPWLKTIGDLNNDGKTDIIAGGYEDGGLYWYKNPDWKKYKIAEGKAFSTDAEVRDINKDGFQDVVCVRRPGITWFENPGKNETGIWAEHILGTTTVHDIELEDFDGDGDQDIVARNQQEWGKNGDVIHFYRQDTPESWNYTTISCPPGEGLLITDIDRDGKTDVVVNQKWYKNHGNVEGKWTEFTYSETWTHQNAFIATADINGDGKKDLVLTPAELATNTYHISWFEAPANPENTWTEHIIENNLSCAFHFCGCADFDKDGDQDIIVAEMTQSPDPDEIKIFNNGGKGRSWTSHVIDTDGSHSMRIFDADNDGDMDFFGANWRANGKDELVKLWLNNKILPSGHSPDTDRTRQYSFDRLKIPSNIQSLLKKTLNQSYEQLNTDWFGTIQAEAILMWAEKGYPEGTGFVENWLNFHIKRSEKMSDEEILKSYQGSKSRVLRNGVLPFSIYAGTLGVAFPCYTLYKQTKNPDARNVCLSVADAILHYSARDRFGYIAHDDFSYTKWCIPDAGYFSVRGLADASGLCDRKTSRVYLKDAVHQAKTSLQLFFDKDRKLTRTIYFLDQNEPGKTYWCRASGWMVYTLTALLRHLPKENPDYKYFTEMYSQIADGLAEFQGVNGGLHVWVDDPDSPEEVTSTAMTAGCMQEAIDNGWIPLKYESYVNKAWSFILSCVSEDGSVRNAYTGWAIPAEQKQLSMDQHNMGFIPGMVLFAAAQILK